MQKQMLQPESYKIVEPKQRYWRGDLMDLRYLSTLMDDARINAATRAIRRY